MSEIVARRVSSAITDTEQTVRVVQAELAGDPSLQVLASKWQEPKAVLIRCAAIGCRCETDRKIVEACVAVLREPNSPEALVLAETTLTALDEFYRSNPEGL